MEQTTPFRELLSDGGAKAHSITAPESTTSYRAVFTPPV